MIKGMKARLMIREGRELVANSYAQRKGIGVEIVADRARWIVDACPNK